MESRFDEIEIMHIEQPPRAARSATPPSSTAAALEYKRGPEAPAPRASAEELAESATAELPPAARWRRAVAFLIDLSLFVALGLAMTPLLPDRGDLLSLIETEPLAVASLVGFLGLISFYYFFGAWLIWGRTVGGAILDVRVVSTSGLPLDAISVSRRWVVTMLSVFTGFVGFVPALFPARRSVADRMSGTVCVAD